MPFTQNDIIASLSTRQTSTRWGIGTALPYLRSVEPCFAGAGALCPTKSLGLQSGDLWQKELAAAAERLTYCDAGMEVTEKSFRDGTGITAGAVLEYDCVLSSRRKDRDGDVVESKGLEIDLKMPLLWQHIQVSPIGKHVALLSQDENAVNCKFAIADTELGRDAATLAKFGALRKSHGFKPIEFEPIEIVKNAAGQDVARGWHVKRAGVMEGSLVSIPANVDGNITAVYAKEFDGLATAFSRGLLHNEVVKSYAKGLYDRRPVMVPVGIDLAVKSGGSEAVYNPIAGRWQDPVTKQFVAPRDLNASVDTKSETAKKCQKCGGMCDSNGKCGDCEKASKATTPPDTKAASGAAALETKMYGMTDDYLEGSYEWVSDKLRKTAKNYLLAKNTTDVSDGYCYMVATLGDKAVVCLETYASNYKRRCFEIDWKADANGVPQWSGEPKEVEIKAQIVEKLLGDLKTKAANLTGMSANTPAAPTTTTIKQLAQRLAAEALTSDQTEALKACDIVAEAAFMVRQAQEERELAELLAAP